MKIFFDSQYRFRDEQRRLTRYRFFFYLFFFRSERQIVWNILKYLQVSLSQGYFKKYN